MMANATVRHACGHERTVWFSEEDPPALARAVGQLGAFDCPACSKSPAGKQEDTMMTRVTIEHRCGHPTEEVIGETSSAGIGAAVAGLQQTDCAACLALPRDAEEDCRAILGDATKALQRVVMRFMASPDWQGCFLVIEAMNGYLEAWEDREQERANR